MSKTTILAAIAAFFIGLAVGIICFPQHHYTEKITEKPAKVKAEVKHESETTAQYVPKVTTPGGQKENTDVEANIGQPAVNVKVNGQPYSFSLLQNEKQKFEDGKLVLNQSSDIGIDLIVKPQVIDRTKRWSVGVGYGGNGLGGKIDFPIGGNENFGGWVYGDKKGGAVGVAIRF